MRSIIRTLLCEPVYRFTTNSIVGSINSKSGVCMLHTTACKLSLSEFFEDRKNWGKTEIRSGRSWKLEELRIKSNEDLHKLWYILLKEKNMLLTMEHFCKERYILFPSPERIDKVEESMRNLEKVVRERNKAYYMLETGQDGEQPGVKFYTAIGLPVFRKQTQHLIPEDENEWFKENFFPGYDYSEVKDFLKLYREKWGKLEHHLQSQEDDYVRGLLMRFKNIDIEALKEVYPNCNVDKLVAENKEKYKYWGSA